MPGANPRIPDEAYERAADALEAMQEGDGNYRATWEAEARAAVDAAVQVLGLKEETRMACSFGREHVAPGRRFVTEFVPVEEGEQRT